MVIPNLKSNLLCYVGYNFEIVLCKIEKLHISKYILWLYVCIVIMNSLCEYSIYSIFELYL